MQVLPYYFLFHYITEQKSKESGTYRTLYQYFLLIRLTSLGQVKHSVGLLLFIKMTRRTTLLHHRHCHRHIGLRAVTV